MSTLASLAGRPETATAIDDGTRARSWGTLEERTNAFANGLLDLAGAAGRHLVIVVGNRLEFVEVVLGAWRAGLVFSPLKSGLTAPEIDVVLAGADTRVVVTDRPAAREAAGRRGLAVLDLDDDIDGWLSRQSTAPQPTGRCGWKLPYTSGTTGRPKGVVPTGAGTVPFDRSFVAGGELAALVRLPGEGVHLFVSRLFHGAPLTFGLGALARGATLRLVPRWDARHVLAQLADADVTSTCMVPTMFRQLLALDGVDRSRPPAPGLRTLLHGGEPCPDALKRQIVDWFGPVAVEYYGFTEGAMTVADCGDWEQRPGTVGRPMPGLSVRIVDEQGRAVPPRTRGTVTFVATTGRRFAYLHDDGRTESAHIGDGFTVGDVGWLDEDGYLYLCGRQADVIVSAGVNIYPAEIEAVLADTPGAADLCAVGGPDDISGERVVLFVVLAAGADEAAVHAAIDERCGARLAPYKWPRETVVCPDLPRDAVGKLLRAVVRDRLWPET